MKIIKYGKIPNPKRIVTCECCKTEYEVSKSECEVTSQMGVMHDNLGCYNYKCPVCHTWNYFNF